MRKKGVEIPRRALSDRYTQVRRGKLVIMDATDQGLHRMVKVARLNREGPIDAPLTLYEPHILWANDGRFMLSGFERTMNEAGEVVDYAQSWLCMMDDVLPEPEIAGPTRKVRPQGNRH